MLGRNTRRRILAAAAVFGLVAFGTVATSTAASAAPTPDLVVEAPLDGTVLDSTDFVFSGTAPVGTGVVYAFFGTSDVSEPVYVGADGAWSFDVHLPRGGEPVQIVAIGVTPQNTPLGNEGVTVTPAPFLAAPVVVSPADGSTVATSAVTVRGTALPDSVVNAAAYDSGVASDFPWCAGYVVSDANGDWSLECTLPNANYAVSAYLVDAAPVADEYAEQTSQSSLSFFAVAAPTAPAAVPAAPAAPAAPVELAATGAAVSDAGLVGALLLLAGAIALLAARRRAALSPAA